MKAFRNPAHTKMKAAATARIMAKLIRTSRKLKNFARKVFVINKGMKIGPNKAVTPYKMNALQLIVISNNLGDSRSMVTHPATTTHMRIGADERAKLGIGDGVVRLSVGLEHAQDLINDLKQALENRK